MTGLLPIVTVAFALAQAPAPPQPPLGGLQLDVTPHSAQVFVDGAYIGIVDQFRGYYQHMDIPAGFHRVEIYAPDYEPLAFETVISPTRTQTFRASMSWAYGGE